MDRTVEFTPPKLLGNPHVQSVLASLKLRRRFVRNQASDLLHHSRSYILQAGPGNRLQGILSAHPRQSRDLVVLIHGWEGSADSIYMMVAANRLWHAGFNVFRLNLRDHGNTHHLNKGLFHANRIDEVVTAIRNIQNTFFQNHLFLAGFSLGGNFALRVAVRAPAAGIQLKRVMAICPVLNPIRTMWALENGWPVYHWYFLKKWRRSLEKKSKLFPDLKDLHNLDRFNTLTQMTDYFVPRYTPYPDTDAYLNGYAIVGDVLSSLQVPSFILCSQDDPIIPVDDLKRIAKPDCLNVKITAHGGHCGFIGNWRFDSWANDHMVRFFRRQRSNCPNCK